jgi:hypothetical protein
MKGLQNTIKGNMTDLTNFINSLTGLITAIASMIGGVATFFATRHVKKSNESANTPEKGKRLKLLMFISSLFLIIISVSIFFGRFTIAETPAVTVVVKGPLNERLTSEAWDFFNKKDYRAAIATTQECIHEFQVSANREQAELKGQSAPVPPIGKVSDEEKAVIFQSGLLNDVATCFFIQGHAAENLGLIEDAKRSYRQAETYPFARTWDPIGQFFWSPAQAATDRLSLFE